MDILIPLPRKDFDPTETAIPWSILNSGCRIIFATPDGIKPEPDRIMLTGKGLGILGHALRANKEARKAFELMEASEEYCNPITWEEANEHSYGAVLLAGGHAPGMKEYLESELIQNICVRHMQKNKPMAAICHGTLVLARAAVNGKSLLYGRKITALPRSSEMLAWEATRRSMGDYFRTYPETTVEDEVREHLKEQADLVAGPPTIVRDSLNRLWAGHAVVDGNLVTARWPGDAHRFAMEFKEMLA